jgi:glycerol-3-phosphate dehydrogenase (NAD(P)+)
VQPYSYDRLAEVTPKADLVVVGVNSLGVDWAATMLSPLLRPQCPVLMLTKGLEGDGKRLCLLPEALRSGLPPQMQGAVQIAAIGGPSIAGELAALAVGIVGGLLERDGVAENSAVMHNQSAAIFAQGLVEMEYLVQWAGGRRETVYSLPGAGDLYVTSMGGRNGRMGRWLGLGMPYSDAKKKYMAAETIEGAELALAIGPTVETLALAGELDARRIPLLRHMIQIVCNDAPVKMPWDEFFAR